MISLQKIDLLIRDLNHKRIDFMRALVLEIFKLLFDQKHIENNEPEADRILIFRLDDKIGDSITSTGFLKSIKANYPQKRLVVLAGPSAKKVFADLDFIDEVIVSKKGLLATLKTFFKLRRSKYLFAVNTSHLLSPRLLFLNRFLNAAVKISFLNSNFKMFSRHVHFDLNTDHVTKRYQATLRLMNIEAKIADYSFYIQPPFLQLAEEKLKPFRQPDSRLIFLNSFAGARLRNLNSETTIHIVQKLLIDPKNLIISVGNENDMPLLTEWKKHFSDQRWLSFSDQTGFEFNCALLQLADLVITPDTAFVHLASALKKKLICIFREDLGLEKNQQIWAPYQTKALVIEAPYKIEKPEDINTFDIEKVIEASKELFRSEF